MESIVIYKSKSGFSKKYAKWIAEELKADIFEASKVNVNMLKKYDNIIYGAGLYAVGINGIKFIKDNLEKLSEKKIIIFATGASPWKKEVVDEVLNKNFSIQQQKLVKFFYLRGGFDYNKLTLFNKFLMQLLKIKLKKRTNLTADDKGMLAAYSHSMDFANKKNISEIISYIKG